MVQEVLLLVVLNQALVEVEEDLVIADLVLQADLEEVEAGYLGEEVVVEVPWNQEELVVAVVVVVLVLLGLLL